MKISFKLSVSIFLILIFLIFLNTVLYFKNVTYSHENEKLILENDSVISVTIELRDSIHKIISKNSHP